MKKIKMIDGSEIPVGKIVCVGRNYAEHAKELGNEVPEFPLIFMKPASGLIHSGEKVIHPDFSVNMHYEAELVLLISKEIKNGDDQTASEAIGGYGIGLDMTLRDIQDEMKRKGYPWTIAKCFDTSAVVSDFVSSENYLLTGNEKINLWLNDILKQDSELNKMIFSPVKVVKYLSSKMTLERGDIVFTGTPAGVGRVMRGDKIRAAITNIAELETEII